MNAPWWRVEIAQTDGTLKTSDEPDEDLLPPFFD